MNSKIRKLRNVAGSVPLIIFFATLAYGQTDGWQISENPLNTGWAQEVSPQNVHDEYPRPQMVRDQWKNLNGLWNYAVTPVMQQKPEEWDGQILVPFAIESALSGVKRRVGPENRLWYQHSFTVPDEWQGQRVILHFGAVDWLSHIWINGHRVSQHQGGYDAFSVDISDYINPDDKQEITISVWDPTDEGYQPRGKQVRDPRGIWYTPTTGIWQTVWLEPVPEVSVNRLEMTPDIDNQYLNLRTITSDKNTGNAENYTIRATVFEEGKQIGQTTGKPGEQIQISIPNMKLWSPDSPFLYDIKIGLFKNNSKMDEVDSYFGMREIRLGEAEDGFTRLFLNDKPLFQFGLLDQGFWPDGIYTAPTDEALKYDIEITKKMGYNMIRKHVKVEPNRWYYWADKLGVLVWQDMPNGDKHIGPDEPDIDRTAQSAYNYKSELNEIVTQLYNHPSIVTWVPFNEGWGQFATAEITQFIVERDPSRLVNSVSGWADRGVSDMNDIHSYPGPDMPKPEEDRAAILGEFGGQALAVEDHLWVQDFSKAPDHFETSETGQSLRQRYTDLIEKLIPLKRKGLAGAVYTQTTDVESEVNGIMTYDREVIKFDAEHMQKLHQRLISGD